MRYCRSSTFATAARTGRRSKLVEGTENVVYDYRGTVSCVCPRTGTQRQMRYGGFEKERSTLKYRCPAEHYGYECAGRDRCSVGKALRIDIEQECRVSTLLPRHSLSGSGYLTCERRWNG